MVEAIKYEQDDGIQERYQSPAFHASDCKTCEIHRILCTLSGAASTSSSNHQNESRPLEDDRPRSRFDPSYLRLGFPCFLLISLPFSQRLFVASLRECFITSTHSFLAYCFWLCHITLAWTIKLSTRYLRTTK